MATNSHVCVFQRLAFSSIVAGFKSRPILSFALASNRGHVPLSIVVLLLDKTHPKKQLLHIRQVRGKTLFQSEIKPLVCIYKVSTILKLDRIPVTFKMTIV